VAQRVSRKQTGTQKRLTAARQPLPKVTIRGAKDPGAAPALRKILAQEILVPKHPVEKRNGHEKKNRGKAKARKKTEQCRRDICLRAPSESNAQMKAAYAITKKTEDQPRKQKDKSHPKRCWPKKLAHTENDRRLVCHAPPLAL